jgi:hypothetical protein
MRQIKLPDLYFQAERIPSAVFNPNGKIVNPNGVVPLAKAQAAETLSGFETGGAHSQGSSFLATLGFEPESLWDSPILQLCQDTKS